MFLFFSSFKYFMTFVLYLVKFVFAFLNFYFQIGCDLRKLDTQWYSFYWIFADVYILLCICISRFDLISYYLITNR